MRAVLLSVHVLAAIILIGPITVVASAFPRYALSAASAEDPTTAPGLAAAAALHRIGRGYLVPATAVPVFGIGVGAAMGVLAEAWVIVSMLLTGLSAVLLVGRIYPLQRRILQALCDEGAPVSARLAVDVRQLAMTTGIFATLWAVVVVIMIVRPGSTTGV